MRDRKKLGVMLLTVLFGIAAVVHIAIAGGRIILSLPALTETVTWTNNASLIKLRAIEVVHTGAVDCTNTIGLIRKGYGSFTSQVVNAEASTTQTAILSPTNAKVFVLRPGDKIQYTRSYTSSAAIVIFNYEAVD